MNSYPERRINSDFDAPNVIELAVDHALVVDSHAEVKDILDPGYFEGLRISGTSGIGLYSVCPGWNGDLRWISPGNHQGFAFFDSYFEKLQIAEKTQSLLGNFGDLIMYSGFFVIRSKTTEPNYHHDYSTGVGLNAFTLMTPLSATHGQGNLLYKNIAGDEQLYQYEPGTAVCFGADFLHSTQPFESETPYVFLCFTYGVRNHDLWNLIAETVTEQGIFYRHPQRGIVELEM